MLQYFGFVEVNCAFDRYVVLDPLSILKSELAVRITENSDISYLKDAVSILESGSTSKASMIINRNEVGTWTLGSLDSINDRNQKNNCIQIIIASEMKRMELGLVDISASKIVQPEFNPCILRTFISEKINVLKAASIQLK